MKGEVFHRQLQEGIWSAEDREEKVKAETIEELEQHKAVKVDVNHQPQNETGAAVFMPSSDDDHHHAHIAVSIGVKRAVHDDNESPEMKLKRAKDEPSDHVLPSRSTPVSQIRRPQWNSH